MAGRPSAGVSILQGAHVVAARALDQHREFQAVARDGFVVDDGRGVVARVRPVYGAPDDGFSQVALLVAPADALVYGGPDLTARDPDFAPQLDEEHGVSRVLAEGDAPLAGDLGVLQEAFDHLAPELRLLVVERPAQGGQVLLRQTRVRLDAQVAHRFGDRSGFYLAQCVSLRPPRAKVSIGGVLASRVSRSRPFEEIVTFRERLRERSSRVEAQIASRYVSSGAPDSSERAAPSGGDAKARRETITPEISDRGAFRNAFRNVWETLAD